MKKWKGNGNNFFTSLVWVLFTLNRFGRRSFGEGRARSVSWAMIGLVFFGGVGGGCGTANRQQGGNGNGDGTSGGLFVRSEVVSEQVVRVPAQTNYVNHLSPALSLSKGEGDKADQSLVTSTATLIITPETLLTNYVTNVVYAVNPKVESTLRIARTINGVVNPTPSAPLVGIGLTGLSAVLGWIARVKSNKARLVPTLIQGIEAAAVSSPEGAQAVKDAISALSKAHGVSDALHAEVQRLTTGIGGNGGTTIS